MKHDFPHTSGAIGKDHVTMAEERPAMSQEFDAAATIGDVSSDAPELAPDLTVGVSATVQLASGKGASAEREERASIPAEALVEERALAELEEALRASPQQVDLWRQLAALLKFSQRPLFDERFSR